MVKSEEITPIFVLGSARNGTTWLGNMLACHPKIAGAHHQVHWGIDESNIYQSTKYAGDFSDDRQYIQFLEAYACSDYFVLSKGDKDYFYQHRPSCFEDFFLNLMDEFARKEGVNYWVTKLDPDFFLHKKALRRFLQRLYQRYSRVKFIGIRRDFPGVLNSYLNMEGANSIYKLSPLKKRMGIILESARYVSHYCAIELLVAAHDGLYLSFSDFRKNHMTCLNRIGEYLDLDFAGADRYNPYNPNSSFAVQGRISKVSKLFCWMTINAITPFFNVFHACGDALLRIWEKSRSERCPYYWRMHRMKYMKDTFALELRRTGEKALHNELFGSHKEEKSVSYPPRT